MNTLLKASLPVAIALSLTACNLSNSISNDDDDTARMTLETTNLVALGDDFDYEGWIIVDGAPVSTGKFDIVTVGDEAETDPAVFNLDVTQANAATEFVLTIEPVENDPPEPAATHILAGDISSDATNNRVASIVTDGTSAIGSDFGATTTKGDFILATPSNGTAPTSNQGIWYLVPPVAPAGPTPSLTLPTLQPGWVYEGWIVGADGPISTGTFTSASGSDSDLAGPAAGSIRTSPPLPALPGQDFIDPLLVLVGLDAVISVEPSPDNDVDTPFSIKPLATTIVDSGNVLNNISADNLPSATVSIQF